MNIKLLSTFVIVDFHCHTQWIWNCQVKVTGWCTPLLCLQRHVQNRITEMGKPTLNANDKILLHKELNVQKMRKKHSTKWSKFPLSASVVFILILFLD